MYGKFVQQTSATCVPWLASENTEKVLVRLLEVFGALPDDLLEEGAFSFSRLLLSERQCEFVTLCCSCPSSTTSVKMQSGECARHAQSASCKCRAPAHWKFDEMNWQNCSSALYVISLDGWVSGGQEPARKTSLEMPLHHLETHYEISQERQGVTAMWKFWWHLACGYAGNWTGNYLKQFFCLGCMHFCIRTHHPEMSNALML